MRLSNTTSGPRCSDDAPINRRIITSCVAPMCTDVLKAYSTVNVPEVGVTIIKTLLSRCHCHTEIMELSILVQIQKAYSASTNSLFGVTISVFLLKERYN